MPLPNISIASYRAYLRCVVLVLLGIGGLSDQLSFGQTAETIAVAKSVDATRLSSTANPSLVAAPIVLLAVVVPPPGGTSTPTGMVTFFEGEEELGSAPLTYGTAALTVHFATPGSHFLVAQYGGDAKFLPSTSTTLTEIVQSPAVLKALTPTVVSGVGNTLGITLPLKNFGTTAVSDVEVTSISMGTAMLLGPTKLPLDVGDIAAGAQRSIEATFDVTDLKVGSNHELTVSGNYSTGHTTSSFSVEASVTVPPEPVVSLGINKSDQLLEQAKASDGTVVDYFGAKDSNGYAKNLTEISVKTLNGLNLYGFDSKGRLVLAKGSDGTVFNVTWVSAASAVVIATSADGTKHAAVSVNMAVPTASKLMSFPTADLLEDASSQTLGQFLRNPESARTAQKSAACNGGAILSTKSPSSGLTCGQNAVCTQVTECGPSDQAIVTVDYSTNLQSTTLPGTLLGPNTGIYTTLLPQPGAIAEGFENVCSAVSDAFDTLCEVADGLLPQACALLANPTTVEFVIPCLAIAEGLKVACEINGGGLPQGAPSLFEGFCSVVTKAIDLAQGTEAVLSASALIPGVGALAGTSATVPLGGPYPLLQVQFPNNVAIQSFTTDPVDPPAGVGYVATAIIQCAPANTAVNLSIIGTDGFTESTSCTVQGNSSCSMFVPGAGEPGIVDTLTAQIPGGPTATAVNIFQ